jgi:hypothetical protein
MPISDDHTPGILSLLIFLQEKDPFSSVFSWGTFLYLYTFFLLSLYDRRTGFGPIIHWLCLS